VPDVVALTPATVPLSIDTPVPSVVEVSHLVRNPDVPPVSDEPRPSDEVEVQLVFIQFLVVRKSTLG
jgi:hypothetical protein